MRDEDDAKDLTMLHHFAKMFEPYMKLKDFHYCSPTAPPPFHVSLRTKLDCLNPIGRDECSSVNSGERRGGVGH